MHTHHRSGESLAIGRRTVLGAVGATVASSLAAPFIRSAAAASTIKVGIVLPKQGPQTEQAANIVNGCRIALDQVASKVLDQPCEIVWLDEPNPQGGQQNMEKMIQQDGVVGVVGGGTSATALAEAAVAKRLRVPLIVSNAAAREITGKDCNRYTFRTNVTVPVACRAVTPSLLERGKRWYFITASYAYGQDIANSFKELLNAAGGTQVGADQTPAGTVDFSSYVLKIRQAKPDVVIAGIAGDDLTGFLKQYAEIGLNGQIPVSCPIISDSDIKAVGTSAAGGIYGKVWDHADPQNSPEEKAFTAAHVTQYGKPPTDKGFLGWISMKLLLQGVAEAKSTEGGKVVQALEKVRFGEGLGQASFRDFDHQILRRMLAVSVKDKITDNSYFDILKSVPAGAADLDALYGSKTEIGCSLGDL